MKTPYSILLLFFLTALKSFSHVDDSGDVHPRIVIEKGNFAVYFNNNKTKKNLKTTLDPSGKIIKARIPILAFPSQPLPLKLPEDQTGVNISKPDAFYVIPEWHRKHAGKPHILKLKDGKKTVIKIDWGDTEIDEVHGAAFEDKFYVLAASKVLPEERDPYLLSPFHFYAFSKKSLKIHKSAEIGKPLRIYSFPQASKVSNNKGYSYIAWMGPNEDEGPELYLSQFDPITGKIITKKISKGHGNSSPSIGIINDKILIAFHKPSQSISYYGEKSKILYIHKSLKNLFPDNR